MTDLRRAAAVVLVAAVAVTGCTGPGDPTPFRVRAGDFLILEYTVLGEAGDALWATPSPVHAYAGHDLPRVLPPGWTPEGTEALPPALVAALRGSTEGAEVQTDLVPPAGAYGDRRPDRLLLYPLREEVATTFTNVSRDRLAEPERGADAGERVNVTFLGRTTRAVVLAASDGSVDYRVEVDGDLVGERVRHPSYWNANSEMWESVVEAVSHEAVIVRHEAVAGANISYGGKPYPIIAVEAEGIRVDLNHPLAGRAVAFRARVVDIVFPESGSAAPAPDFALVDVDGALVRLDALRGRPVVLYFFATWCSICRVVTPEIAEVARVSGGNVSVVAVSVDPIEEAATVRAYREKHERGEGDLPWRFAVDRTGEVTRAYSVINLPKTVVLDADGRYAKVKVGLVKAAEVLEAMKR